MPLDTKAPEPKWITEPRKNIQYEGGHWECPKGWTVAQDASAKQICVLSSTYIIDNTHEGSDE